MNVYTYHEDLEHANSSSSVDYPTNPILRLFKRSWEYNGWTVYILSRSDAEANPHYSDYLKAISQTPTVNDREFETACYLRYLAMLRVSPEGGLLMDTDVINYSFTPDMLPNLPEFTLQRGSGTFGSQCFYGWLCYELSHWNRTRVIPWLINGSAHWSDMVFLSACVPSVNLCTTCGQDQWKTSALVHYSNGSLFSTDEIPTSIERAKRIAASRPMNFL